MWPLYQCAKVTDPTTGNSTVYCTAKKMKGAADAAQWVKDLREALGVRIGDLRKYTAEVQPTNAVIWP